MLDFTQKLAAATSDYEAARVNLENVRIAYESGVQKDYGETKANLSELEVAIKNDEINLDKSKEDLQHELVRSYGLTNDAVRNLMNDRRSTEELLEQRRFVLLEVRKRLSDLRIAASTAGREYENAYDRAANCWWKMQTYIVLSECGQRLCDLLAVDTRNTTHRHFDSGALIDNQLPNVLFFKEIKSMMEGYDGETMPYRSELGVFDLKDFPRNKMLTICQIAARKFD